MIVSFCSRGKKLTSILLFPVFFIFNSREAIAAIIGDIVVFYNSKNLNCIGALSFFLRSVHTFS